MANEPVSTAPVNTAPVNTVPETTTRPEMITKLSRDTRLLAVEVLLADPEALENDALEGDLYILRDNLRAQQPG